MNELEIRLREEFDDMVVYKDLSQSGILKDLKLPSFLRDWILKRFESEEDGKFDAEELQDFVKEKLPNAEDWLGIKNSIVTGFEEVKILARIEIDIDIKTGEISFSLPDYGLGSKETMIEPQVWYRIQKDLVSASETWGVLTLRYRPPETEEKPPKPGKVQLVDFESFTPYEPDLDSFREIRSEFTTQEWMQIICGAMDYQAEGFGKTDSERESQCIALISRLLPSVEKNLNLLELAPKGTGKSYVFGNLNKLGLLVDGGTVTRAKMFYDSARNKVGYIQGHDFVAIDEVKKVVFSNTSEMQSVFQGYLEAGKCTVNGKMITSDAGVVFLGNIEAERFDATQNMLVELPALFKESAFLDRIHGFIRGWDIPPVKPESKMKGWALNTEYFFTILHELREELIYRKVVDELIIVPPGAYERHVEAVKRLSTALLKLLFPHVTDPSMIEAHEFNHYVLKNAFRMRQDIQGQLQILDKKEYRMPEKHMPSFKIREELCCE